MARRAAKAGPSHMQGMRDWRHTEAPTTRQRCMGCVLWTCAPHRQTAVPQRAACRRRFCARPQRWCGPRRRHPRCFGSVAAVQSVCTELCKIRRAKRAEKILRRFAGNYGNRKILFNHVFRRAKRAEKISRVLEYSFQDIMFGARSVPGFSHGCFVCDVKIVVTPPALTPPPIRRAKRAGDFY